MYKRVTGIYAIRHKDRTYFGSAVCTTGRINMHKRELRQSKHSNSYLQRVYDKYEGEGFTFEVVEECSREALRHLEQQYIDNHKGELFNLDLTVCELAAPEVHSKRMKTAWANRSEDKKTAMAAKISGTLKRRYQERPEELEKAKQALAKGRASKALKERKTSPEANEKRRLAAKAQWAKRSEAERKAVGAKIASGMKVNTTPKQRSEAARKAANSRIHA